MISKYIIKSLVATSLLLVVASLSSCALSPDVNSENTKIDNRNQGEISSTTKLAPVFPRLENYVAPPYPKTKIFAMEAYDYRIRNNSGVFTPKDAFICGVWFRFRDDLHRDVSKITSNDIMDAFAVYANTKNFRDLSDFRPWTHKHFLASLTESERVVLAQEVFEYAQKTPKNCN